MQDPMVVMNALDTHEEQRTFVVFGQYRGGTSMVAGVLRLLGINMGDRITIGNNEDRDFQAVPGERVAELIECRNASHDVWGWKYPGVHFSGDQWLGSLRNPRFIGIFRDPVASAQSEMWLGGRPNFRSLLRAKHEHQDGMLKWIDRLDALRRPIALISYERALMNPSRLVDDLVEFCGATIDPNRRAEIVEFIMPERGHGEPSIGPTPREVLQQLVMRSELPNGRVNAAGN